MGNHGRSRILMSERVAIIRQILSLGERNSTCEEVGFPFVNRGGLIQT
jgi:hypothetical protein